jgi:hypothetical protein
LKQTEELDITKLRGYAPPPPRPDPIDSMHFVRQWATYDLVQEGPRVYVENMRWHSRQEALHATPCPMCGHDCEVD